MSTFGGKLEEIPDISVDRFDDDNLDSLAYFLSHCHSDHMVGLCTRDFQNGILQENKFLYASDVSSVILKRMFPSIENNIIVLDIYKPTVIMLKDKAISVTPIPAGHCPGSVMFLFECGTLAILYTGDYRIHKNDIRRVKSFYNSMNKVKKIDKIYLDTTFFLKSYLSFPKRQDSLNEICRLIKEWIIKSNDHVIHLVTSAKYGYEYVFNEIYKKIGMPVHVNYEVYRIYSIIPEMDDSVTVYDASTQIHSNCGYRFQGICSKCDGKEIKRIKVSAFRWTQDTLETGLSYLENDVHYVCYSTHASYEEGVELIKLLKPRSIEACVKHNDPYVNVQMIQLLDRCLMDFKREEVIDSHPKGFTVNSVNIIKDDSDTKCNPLDSDLLNSPPREKIGDLRRFLKKHSSSFVLNQQCGGLKIDEEEDEGFNFEQEFGLEQTDSIKIEGNIKSEESGNHLLTVNASPKCSKEVLELCDFKTKDDTAEITHIDNAECIESEVENEQDAFREWCNASPDRNIAFELENTTKISVTTTDVAKDDNDNESKLVDNILSNACSYTSLNNADEIKKDKDLLKDIFFLESTPPLEEKTDMKTTNSKSDSPKGNGDISDPWDFDLSPKNQSENKLNTLETIADFLYDTFGNASGIEEDSSSDSHLGNVESTGNKTDCPPRKKPR